VSMLGVYSKKPQELGVPAADVLQAGDAAD
jgi:hypothetical protein